MTTTLSYLTNATFFRQHAIVIQRGVDENGSFIVTNTTPAYPQGGGQECDHGFVISNAGQFQFTDVRFYAGVVKHYLTDGLQSLKEGNSIEIVVNENRRNRNSILHTAGHLIASVAFRLIPGITPTKGHHFSDGAYVVLFGEATINLEEAKAKLQAMLNEEIMTAKAVSSEIVTLEDFQLKCPFIQPGIPNDKPLRIVTIETYFPMGCGGTHVQKLNEIPMVIITKVKSTKGIVKINYKCF